MIKNPLKLVFASAVLASTHASAQLINFSASGNSPSGLVVLDYGSDGDSNYNSLTGSSFVTSTGAVSTVSNSLTGDDNETTHVDNTSPITQGDDNLMGTYAYKHNGTMTDTLSGLTVGDTFTLVVYASGDPGGEGSVISLNEGLVNLGTASTTGADRLIENGKGDAYQEFTGILATPTLTFTLTNLNDSDPNGVGQYSAFNGLQLEEVPEPGTYAMLGFGFALLALTLRVRRTVAV